MRVRLIRVVKLRSGGVVRREERVETDQLSVGRGTDNAITLSDLAVDLHHAEFHLGADGIYVAKKGTSPLFVDSRVSPGERVEPGNVVRVGSLELKLIEPGPDTDLALELSELRERTNELDELRKRTHLGLESGLFSRRKLSWAGVIVGLAMLVAVPLALPRFQTFWSTGEMSNKHAFISSDCQKCHEGGFQRVRDDACLACHSEIGAHPPQDVKLARLDETRCATCHREHNGAMGLVIQSQPLCADCHSNLSQQRPETSIANASDFGSDHPELKLFLVTKPGEKDPQPTEWSRDLRENSGLRFSHWRHVGQEVSGTRDDAARLTCDKCHQMDAAGQYFAPIVFEDHCQRCHQLTFDNKDGLARREVIHQSAASVRQELREIYSGIAFRGEAKDESGGNPFTFIRPGRALSEDEKSVVDVWVKRKIAAAELRFFDKLDDDKLSAGACALCHDLDTRRAADGGREVSPVEVANVWMPRSEFLHDTHRVFACRDCHPRAAVIDPEEGAVPDWAKPGSLYALSTPQELEVSLGLTPSKETGDVLVPGIAPCQSCHGGAGAKPPKVPSSCVLCHDFHRADHGPMRMRNSAHNRAAFGVESAPLSALDRSPHDAVASLAAQRAR